MQNELSLLEAIWLGVVQGLTEFLPVSSSGHLVISQHCFGIVASEAVLFDLLLHVGTLGAVLVLFRQDVVRLLHALPALPGQFFAHRGSWSTLSPDARAWSVILLGTLVTGIFGILLEDPLEAFFDRLSWVGFFLILTGVLLLSTKGRGEVASDEESSILPGITLWHAVLIGLAQGVAIAPGLSRSGATIAVALLLGIPRVPAVRFSFLLSIPAILGGTLLKARHGFDALPTLPAVAGTTISFVSGLLFLWTLLWIVRAGRFHLFAYYTIPAGVAVIAYTLLG